MKYLILLTFLFTSACSTSNKNPSSKLDDNWIKHNCNKDSAYSIGTEDAYNRKEHDSKPFEKCNYKISGSLKKVYSDAYKSTNTSTIQDTANSPETTQIKVADTKKTETIYTCSKTIKNSTFTDQGTHLGKTKFSVVEKCRDKFSSLHCNYGVKCKEEKK
jgi:hypothetical protein